MSGKKPARVPGFPATKIVGPDNPDDFLDVPVKTAGSYCCKSIAMRTAGTIERQTMIEKGFVRVIFGYLADGYSLMLTVPGSMYRPAPSTQVPSTSVT